MSLDSSNRRCYRIRIYVGSCNSWLLELYVYMFSFTELVGFYFFEGELVEFILAKYLLDHMR